MDDNFAKMDYKQEYEEKIEAYLPKEKLPLGDGLRLPDLHAPSEASTRTWSEDFSPEMIPTSDEETPRRTKRRDLRPVRLGPEAPTWVWTPARKIEKDPKLTKGKKPKPIKGQIRKMTKEEKMVKKKQAKKPKMPKQVKGKYGKGGAKRILIPQEVTSRNLNPSVRRLARRAGVRMMSSAIFKEAIEKSLIRQFLAPVIRDMITYTDGANRKTVRLEDVTDALARHGKPHYFSRTPRRPMRRKA